MCFAPHSSNPISRKAHKNNRCSAIIQCIHSSVYNVHIKLYYLCVFGPFRQRNQIEFESAFPKIKKRLCLKSERERERAIGSAESGGDEARHYKISSARRDYRFYACGSHFYIILFFFFLLLFASFSFRAYNIRRLASITNVVWQSDDGIVWASFRFDFPSN